MNFTVKLLLRRLHTRALSLTITLAALTAAFSGTVVHAADVRLEGRAVLPAATFANGPVSGQFIGAGQFNGITVPFAKQPAQGFSAVLKNNDGSFSVMADNGYGALENSADFLLRVYRIKPDFETVSGGSGRIAVQSFIQLRDPDHRIPFAIVNHFSSERLLTGADFDIESIQRASDGSLWFGDEFGPFLLHTDATGRLLERPIPLPDFTKSGQEVRSPQSPYSEESSALRIMNAVHAHAVKYGNTKTPVFSPYHVMLDDGNSANDHYARGPVSPAGSGLAPAASDIFNVAAMQTAGYPVVCWTVNTTERMTELMKLKLSGIISDRPDLLLAAVRAFDANGDGIPGDFIGADGLIDVAKFDAQAHRGGRNLRLENTLPSMEVGLDNLMTTLETDIAITKDFMPVLDHDPHVQAVKVRRADGAPYTPDSEKLVKDLTFAELQHQYIADKIIRDPAFQKNDPALSPVTLAFKAVGGIPHEYAMPSLQQLFRFVQFYCWYYQAGPGVGTPNAMLKWKNAVKVRFNLETKINPRVEFASRTFAPWVFTLLVGGTISLNGMQDRADIQSFDFRSLLLAQRCFPQIRTVYLFGDFPIYADRSNPDSDDSTNLQDENGANTPWLAGLYWPYRVTALSNAFRAKRSGGFEGMAITPDGKSCCLC